MGFGYRTVNRKNDVQKKSVIVGRELGWSELYIYAVFTALGFYFLFIANITVAWKAIAIWLCFTSAVSFTRKYKERTLWQWFRIFLRKKTRGGVSVDRGADYKYFTRIEK